MHMYAPCALGLGIAKQGKYLLTNFKIIIKL